jgi:hypothetical protein
MVTDVKALMDSSAQASRRVPIAAEATRFAEASDEVGQRLSAHSGAHEKVRPPDAEREFKLGRKGQRLHRLARHAQRFARPRKP